MGIKPIKYFKKNIVDLSADPFARCDFHHYFNAEKFVQQFPKNMKFKRLRDIVTLIETGQSVEREDYSITESDYIHLVPRDIKKGNLDIRDPIYLNPERGEELKDFRLIQDDILIAISSNCGDSALFSPPESDKHYTISHYVLRVRVDHKVYNPDFLVYYLNHPKIKTYFRAIEAGKLQQNLSKVYIRNFPIIDLPLEDQEKTAAVLRLKRKEINFKQSEIDTLRQDSTNLIWDTIEQNF